MGATYSDNPSDGIAQKSKIGPKLTMSNMKWRLTKEHWVQPERGQTKDREGRMDREVGVEKGSGMTGRKRVSGPTSTSQSTDNDKGLQGTGWGEGRPVYLET